MCVYRGRVYIDSFQFFYFCDEIVLLVQFFVGGDFFEENNKVLLELIVL